ncbi:MAG: lytic murein transglycosylase [Deltaproteobacteria bacterium]|nr:lytic murein transglycosylase [Deltaproteobacteria bacterium]
MSLWVSKKYKIHTFIPLLIVFLFWPGYILAGKKNNNHHFEPLQNKLIQDGYDSEKIQRLYDRPQVHFEADGITLLFTYSESKVDYDQFSNDWSIRKAQNYMAKHQDDLERTEKAYGVDKYVITAILLVESSLGKTLGTRSALNTLSTLASLMYPEARSEFYTMIPQAKRTSREKYEKSAKRKSKWAYGELKAFLEYADQEGFDPAEMPGSFAGAMGLAQFMPTSILAYGKDGNNDGTIDLLTHADAMASIANYLKRHGWRPGISRKKAEKVIYHYNHSKYYVKAILKIAKRLES